MSGVLGSSSGQASSVSRAVPGGVESAWGGLVLKNSLGKTSVCGSRMSGSGLEIVVNADLYRIGEYTPLTGRTGGIYLIIAIKSRTLVFLLHLETSVI